MYVYIMKFERYPSLVKIGKSITPESRARDLSSSHGKLISIDYYPIGKDCFDVESYLHRTFKDLRSQEVRGSGYTEFFSDVVAEKAKEYLKAYALNVDQNYIFEMLEQEISKEIVRYENMIGRLLGYGCAKERQHYPMYTGYLDCMGIAACMTYGYPLEDIAKRFINKEKCDSYRLMRYTTPKRVEMAYRLSKEGSSKLKSLKSLLETKRLPSLSIKNAEVLAHSSD